MSKIFAVFACCFLLAACTVENLEVHPNIFEDPDFKPIVVDSLVYRPNPNPNVPNVRTFRVYFSIAYDKMTAAQQARITKLHYRENSYDKKWLLNPNQNWLEFVNVFVGKYFIWEFSLGDDETVLTKALIYKHTVK